jgi:hypothetical protein
LWVIFALLDPDPDPYSNYRSGSGSTLPIEYGSGSTTLPTESTILRVDSFLGYSAVMDEGTLKTPIP